MEAFGELVKQYGFPIAGLLGALAITGKVILVLWRDLQASYEARLTDKDNEITKGQVREEYFRTKYERALELLEVGTQVTDAVVEGSKRPGRR